MNLLSLWSNILRLRSLLSFFVKINNALDLLAPNLFFFFFFLLLIYLIPPFFAEQQIFGIKDIGKKETTILDSRHKVLYICVGFWLLFNLTRDLSQAKKKINVVTSWANAQNDIIWVCSDFQCDWICREHEIIKIINFPQSGPALQGCIVNVP